MFWKWGSFDIHSETILYWSIHIFVQNACQVRGKSKFRSFSCSYFQKGVSFSVGCQKGGHRMTIHKINVTLSFCLQSSEEVIWCITWYMYVISKDLLSFFIQYLLRCGKYNSTKVWWDFNLREFTPLCLIFAFKALSHECRISLRMTNACHFFHPLISVSYEWTLIIR